jgi:SAM-dependent methyltransferase
MIDGEQEVKVSSKPNCYLCGTRGGILYEGLEDKLFGVHGKWTLKKCPDTDCGLIWLDPMPLADQIPKLYRKYYTHTSSGGLPGYLIRIHECIRDEISRIALGYKGTTRSQLWKAVCLLLSYNSFLRDRMCGTVMWLDASHCGRVLDVGCGDGKMLERLYKLGWNTVGVEPDHDATYIAQSRAGSDIRHGLLEQARFPNESFDVVIMNHVVEHLLDPFRTLKECCRILKSGGQLYMVTPNTSSFGHTHFGRRWRGLEPPRHLCIFSPTNLQIAVSKAGFRLLSIRTLTRLSAQIWSNSDWIGYWLASYNTNAQRLFMLKIAKLLLRFRLPVYQFTANILLRLKPES